MNNEHLAIDCAEVLKLKQEYPEEMEVIIKMLTEVGEGCHLEMDEAKMLVAF